MNLHNPETLFGMHVALNPIPPKPRMTLASNVPVTEKFRAEVNAWMLEFFGTEPDNIYYIAESHTVVMSEHNLRKLRIELGT